MKKKILIIEDDTIMRENTAEIIELAGFDVSTAADGKEGVIKAREVIPDLIICDVMMPKLDGHGVLHILSQDENLRSVPFIFVTAKTEKADIRKGMALGADDYITKPFDDMELIEAINARLKRARIRAEEFGIDEVDLKKIFDEAKENFGLQELSEYSAPVQYQKKQVIYNEGDMPEYLYFIHEGKVKVSRMHNDGKEYVTDVYNKGDFFGHAQMLEHRAYCESAIVLEKAQISKIHKNDFFSLLLKNSDISFAFIKLLSQNVDKRESMLLSMAYDTVRKRTATALLRVATEEDGKLIANTTRDDLAHMIGTATESVIRCLSEFRDDGNIKVEGRKIHIVNKSALEELPY